MKIELEQVSPHEIEKRSFEIITEELNVCLRRAYAGFSIRTDTVWRRSNHRIWR